jgi:hypothetical protein
MAEYIKRMSAMTICERYSQHCFETNDNRGQDIADRIFDEITEIPTADVVEVVRCKDCVHAVELDKHCNISRTAYRHCGLLRGEETKNVWHKYKKYYKDYSLVSLDGFCDEGELKEIEGK